MDARLGCWRCALAAVVRLGWRCGALLRSEARGARERAQAGPRVPHACTRLCRAWLRCPARAPPHAPGTRLGAARTALPTKRNAATLPEELRVQEHEQRAVPRLPPRGAPGPELCAPPRSSEPPRPSASPSEWLRRSERPAYQRHTLRAARQRAARSSEAPRRSHARLQRLSLHRTSRTRGRGRRSRRTRGRRRWARRWRRRGGRRRRRRERRRRRGRRSRRSLGSS